LEYISHYKNTLSQHYSWAFGGLDQNIEKNREFFKRELKSSKNSLSAIDLGSGSGFQSIPLAEMGYQVYSIDTSPELLLEGKKRLKEGEVSFIEDDLRNFTNYGPKTVNLIVCMGDTISHLESLKQVDNVISDSYKKLDEKGQFIISYRDLSNDLEGVDRIIPVRADDDQIFTCMLEFEKNQVRVNDIIYTKTNNQWTLNKSSYLKLKICKNYLLEKIKEVGFKITLDETNRGMTFIVAIK
jgi:SAM-dependent methyltransferase